MHTCKWSQEHTCLAEEQDCQRGINYVSVLGDVCAGMMCAVMMCAEVLGDVCAGMM